MKIALVTMKISLYDENITSYYVVPHNALNAYAIHGKVAYQKER